MVKTVPFECRGHGIKPWLGNKDPTCCTVGKKKKTKQKKTKQDFREIQLIYVHALTIPSTISVYSINMS